MDYASNQYQKENDEILNKTFRDMYMKNWNKNGHRDLKGLELIISPVCNLGCKYCYIHNFGHRLYPNNIRNPKNIVNNTKKLIDWLIDNNLTPDLELFSGEIFGQKVGFDVVDVIYEKYKNTHQSKRVREIIVPTNFTFIQDNELTKRVQRYIDNFAKIGIRFHLSASFDGKFMEANRPYEKDIGYHLNKPRDDEYYDKVFSFIAKNRCGLHPMVYSKNIEKWKDNFLWFQDMMKKHGIPWKHIYLLQVRNAEWSKEQCKELYNFIVWLTEWAFEKLGRNKDRYTNFISYPPYGFNILKSISGKNGRGLACSIQSAPAVRLGDLAFVPCHRLMYEGQEYGFFNIDNNGKIKDIRSTNVEMFLGVTSHDYRSSPYCVSCPIRDLCSGGCLGSQYEITGDPFTPIPTMCAMQHSLASGIIKGWMNIGVFNKMLINMTNEQMYQANMIRRELDKYE